MGTFKQIKAEITAGCSLQKLRISVAAYDSDLFQLYTRSLAGLSGLLERESSGLLAVGADLASSII